jgi:16S rRNA (guanine1207-N2)-methyltransferase
MAERGPVTEVLLLDALPDALRRLSESAERQPGSGERPRALLIGVQAAATVSAANALLAGAGGEPAVLLHLDRATESVGLGLGNRELLLGDDLAALGPFGLIGLNVEAAKSYRLLREIVGQTAESVRTDGVVLVAGPKKGGAEVAARVLRERFAQVDLLAYRKGERIYRATRPRPVADAGSESSDVPSAQAGLAAAPSEPDPVEAVTLRGRTLRLFQDERIFARGRLDAATHMLAEAFEVRPDAAVLDLGSGSGVLGILAALLEPSCRVTLVDSDPLAVEVSRRNAIVNGAGNVSARLSDVLADLPDARFDLILMNPPFHRGRAHDPALAERFMTEASRALLPGGTISMVCNRFLRYEPILERLVGPVREAAGDRQFKVLVARLRRVPQPASGPANTRTSRPFSRERRSR